MVDTLCDFSLGAFSDCPAQKKYRCCKGTVGPIPTQAIAWTVLLSWARCCSRPYSEFRMPEEVLCRQGCYTLVLAYFVFQLGKEGFLCWELHFCLRWVLLRNWSRTSLTQDIPKFYAEIFPPEWDQKISTASWTAEHQPEKTLSVFTCLMLAAREGRMNKWCLLHLSSSTTEYTASFNKPL